MDKSTFQLIQVILSASEKDFLQVINMFTDVSGLHNNIIKTTFKVIMKHTMKSNSQCALVSGTYI